MNDQGDTKAPSSAGDPSAMMSESDYLQQQAQAAKAAIAEAFGELKGDLARGVDPREWMQTHPWITLASAAVAGFAAAAATIPSKEEQALKKLAAIEKAIHGRHGDPSNGHSGDGDKKKEPGGMMAMVLREVIGAVKPAVIAVLSAHLNPQGSPPPQTDPAPSSEQDA
ncbi:MAG TPA: hypothetical protein VG326_21635 [Tepidisphaeraceae bacterium]|jgi:hypothetical protein|nr:hypothetical protein [Tepidisphaeraceae bacterium]